jgi:D-lactate dehydrogenase
VTLYFVETERDEAEYFRESFTGHDVHIVTDIADVKADAEVVCVFIYSPISDEFLEAHPNLRLVCSRSGTLEHIDLPACQRRGVEVSYVPSYGESTVAEHTFALMLALSRRLREVMTASQQSRFSYQSTRGFDLEGKTLGLMGMGRVGQKVVPLARAFKMRVIAYDPHCYATALAGELGFEWVTLPELLAQSDIISLHLRLTAGTFHILDREAFAQCRPGVRIVNTARGRLIDTEALGEALDSGQVGGAGLDVLEDERALRQQATHIIGEEIVRYLQSGGAAGGGMGVPQRAEDLKGVMANDRLLSRPNVIFTPHVAFNSVEAVKKINEVTAASIRRFLEAHS